MSDRRTFVVVGAGLAGAKAVEALRAKGFEGRIVLLGDEVERPYDRPPLSKDYLLDRSEKAKIYVHPEEWYADHDVELRLGSRVTAIDRSTRKLTLEGGGRVGYDRLLLATGSSPRRIGVPGHDLDGVLYLRSVEDCEKLKATFARVKRVAIIGAGWIGLETAVAARAAGCAVTVIETSGLPLVKVLGTQVARLYDALHRRHGVEFRSSVVVAEIVGAGGRVTGVRLADGTEVDADVVVVGIGAVPNTALAEAAGLAIDDGIVVDEHLATTDPDVFAVGDVANVYYPRLGTRLRLGHWSAARKQPPIAAAGMMGQVESYDNIPYFFSDQYDMGMEYLGYVPRGAEVDVVFRGDVASGKFIVFWLSAGIVLAGMNVNIWHITGAIRALVTSGVPVDPSKLGDPAVPFEDVFA